MAGDNRSEGLQENLTLQACFTVFRLFMGSFFRFCYSGRTQDVTESVRKLAYRILAEKVNIRSMSIAQRMQLLSNGLNDRSDSIKELSTQELLGGWLKSFDQDIIQLLKCLDVEGCTEVAELAVKAVLKGNDQCVHIQCTWASSSSQLINVMLSCICHIRSF